MAIHVNTNNPTSLLDSIYRAIDSGTIVTWEYDQDGDFTHTPLQWRKQAWFRPIIVGSILNFGLIGVSKKKMTKGIYGVYHGRFSEELLTHFDADIYTLELTSQQEPNIDIFT